ncbi:hypothetical protein P7K49_010095 [Saguinus oedipus]|uniref:Uncharacterized protein n=1 Tax=Saguinus oedipus TaxID=9490 RepID=A0ABQ9VNA9_SAGOE|nr:hypothetical protein P7K49_010095 [Saguinus oedipus]
MEIPGGADLSVWGGTSCRPNYRIEAEAALRGGHNPRGLSCSTAPDPRLTAPQEAARRSPNASQLTAYEPAFDPTGAASSGRAIFMFPAAHCSPVMWKIGQDSRLLAWRRPEKGLGFQFPVERTMLEVLKGQHPRGIHGTLAAWAKTDCPLLELGTTNV